MDLTSWTLSSKFSHWGHAKVPIYFLKRTIRTLIHKIIRKTGRDLVNIWIYFRQFSCTIPLTGYLKFYLIKKHSKRNFFLNVIFNLDHNVFFHLTPYLLSTNFESVNSFAVILNLKCAPINILLETKST